MSIKDYLKSSLYGINIILYIFLIPLNIVSAISLKKNTEVDNKELKFICYYLSITQNIILLIWFISIFTANICCNCFNKDEYHNEKESINNKDIDIIVE
jgi:hypothetical protein